MASAMTPATAPECPWSSAVSDLRIAESGDARAASTAVFSADYGKKGSEFFWAHILLDRLMHNSPDESAVCSVSDNAEARDIREFIFFLGAFRASMTAIKFCIRFVKVDLWQLKVQTLSKYGMKIVNSGINLDKSRL